MIVVPAGVVDVLPLNVQVRWTHEAVKAATGTVAAAATVIARVSVSVAPALLVTVSTTVYVPLAA